MKRILFLLVILVGTLAVWQYATAQKAKSKLPKRVVTTRPVEKLQEVDVRFGSAGLNGGEISKQQFDALAKEGLFLPGGGTIQGFNFLYAERSRYEDSIGNPILVTDYLNEYCLGSKLSEGVLSSLFERTKPGDTAYFDQIKVITAAGTKAKGTNMKFVLTH